MKVLLVFFLILLNLQEAKTQNIKSISCKERINYRSLKSDSITQIRFTNTTDRKVKIYWLNHLGESILFRTIAPQSNIVQQTYIGHAWLLTWENGECIKIMVAQNSSQQAALIDEMTPENSSASTKAVSNDDAKNAIQLIVDSDFHISNTTNCTLEEHCINRDLTSHCLVYHNDQWFTFTTTDSPIHYLIIKNQNCRDIKGVQILVLDGMICQPESFKLINCTSFATQDDIYIALKGLKSNHTYIINLDGYLEDFCAFEIAISTSLPEFHMDTDKKTDVSSKIRNDSIQFNWELTEELQNSGISRFQILRRFQSDKKFYLMKETPVERLVGGGYKTNYSYTDTIQRTGVYHYKILAIAIEGQKYLLNELSIAASPVADNPYLISPELKLKENSVVDIEIYNFFSNQLLAAYKDTYSSGKFKIDLNPYFTSNVFRIKVVIMDAKRKNKRELVIDKQF